MSSNGIFLLSWFLLGCAGKNTCQSWADRPGRKIRSRRRYIDLKIEGTKVSVALICFNDFGFLPWVPEVPKASDQSPIPPACLLAAIRRVPVNYRAVQ
jgi:hypothetical protein